MAVGFELRLLDDALLGRHEDEMIRREFTNRKGGGDALVLAELDQVHDRFALGLPTCLGDLVNLEPVYPALVREKEDIAVRRGREEPLHEILFLGLHADLTLTAAFLRTVGGQRIALD